MRSRRSSQRAMRRAAVGHALGGSAGVEKFVALLIGIPVRGGNPRLRLV
ncbi:MAG: hypothetical protein RL077_4244 [Verrucomicrobiota bacterium]